MIVSTMKSKQKKPCKGCPFRKESTLEGENPGGSPPEVYIGQAQGPFWLPCHMDENYADKQSDPGCVNQCAGAAIFRANVKDKLRYRLPDELMFLEQDTDLVFASFEEFYAHYKNVSKQEAKDILTQDKLEELMNDEINTWKNLNK